MATAKTPVDHRGRSTATAAMQSLLLAATALFLLNFNALGTASGSKRFSQDLTYAWFGNQSWLYPRAEGPAGGGAPPRPVVVMIDEPALALRGAHWPVPLAFHTEFLAELAVLRPRAIMLDFLLIDAAPPGDTCAFLSVAAELKKGGTPLYLAVTRLEDLNVLDQAGCRDLTGAPLVAAHVLTPVAVRKQVDGADFVNRLYPFEALSADAQPGAGLPSAAVRIYCDARPAPDDCIARMTRSVIADAGFELAWSPQGDPFNQRWSHAACNAISSPSRAILNQPVLPRESPCPPLPTLFASALLDPGADPTLGMQNEQLFSLVDGSFLFVGGNFRGSGDLMITPMHTLLPGIYYHAAALENLLAFDGRPKVRKEFRNGKLGFYIYDLAVLWLLAAIFQWRQRQVDEGQPAGEGPFHLSPSARARIEQLAARIPTPVWVLAVVVVLVLLSAFKFLQLIAVALAAVTIIVIEFRIATRVEMKERLRAAALYCAALGLSLCVIALAIWIGYRWLMLPPGDWIGYLSFAAFGFFVAHTAILEFERRVDEMRRARHTNGGTQ